MDQDNKQAEQQPELEKKPTKPMRPTTADLYNAWNTGGKAKLMEILPDEPDEEDCRMDQQQNQKEAGPTLEELLQGFQEGGNEKVSQMMIVNGRKMVPSPEDLFLAWRDGGKEMLGALMSNMSGDEDGPDPEWNERRWR